LMSGNLVIKRGKLEREAHLSQILVEE
jgi:hypothetical protein